MKLRKLICLFVVSILAVSLAGCSKKKSAYNHENPDSHAKENEFFITVYQGKENFYDWFEGDASASVSWERIKLSDEDAARFPELNEALETYNKDSKENAEYVLTDLCNMAKDSLEYGFGTSEFTWYTDVTFFRADASVVSFIESVYSFTGGVHGNYWYVGKNYDAESGKEINLEDVLADAESLESILNEKIMEKYADVVFVDIESALAEYELTDYQWTMGYDGITFWFSPYEIAPYAAGVQNILISFDEYKDIFNQKYIEFLPENYVTPVMMHNYFDFDLDSNDGKIDSLYVTYSYNDGYSYTLSVEVNGETFIDDKNYGTEFETYLIHMGDKNYICYRVFEESGYNAICVLDINNDNFEIVSENYDMLPAQIFNENNEGDSYGIFYSELLNNPFKLHLEKRFDILGTRGGAAYFAVNENDGTLEMIDDYYLLYDEFDVVSTVPIEFTLLENGKKTEMPAGSSFSVLRTDGKTYVDLLTDDNKEVRLEIDTSEYYPKINGVPETECFEDIEYAW